MIKVMNIISDTNIGGAGSVLLNYIKYCDRSNFEISVVVPRGSLLVPRLESLDVQVFEIDAMADKSYDKEAVKPLEDLIDNWKPDIVHTHGSLSGRIAAKRRKRKIIYTRHCAFPVKGYMRHGPGRWANKLLNEHYADRIIAVGDATKDKLVESGISPKYIEMMLNGCEQVPELPAEERRLLRESYGFSDEDFVVGYMARIEVYKGHDCVLEAVERLLEEGRRVRFIIAGAGNYEEELREHAAKLPEGTVVFAGFIEDVSQILAVMDVHVNASYVSEGSSLSIIEGMSVGLPTIVSNCGGNPLHVEDGINGFVFPMSDSAKLAEDIARLMDDRQLYEKIRTGAHKIYNERFTGQVFARNIENVYRKVMQSAT